MNTVHHRPLPGTSPGYFDTGEAVGAIQPGVHDRLPYTSRVLAENLVHRCDPAILIGSFEQLVEHKRDLDFPWSPARVVCHDILGQTVLVDLAGLRDAITDQGDDPAKVSPVVSMQLITDHSLAVEYGGFDSNAFAKNYTTEDRRNEDRFHFIDWTRLAFKNVGVVPAGDGITHQINLEKIPPVTQVHDGVAYPGVCVGTDSHTLHVDTLSVITIGAGDLGAENVMLGRVSQVCLLDIVGVELTGQRQPDVIATSIVLALTKFPRKQKVVGAYLGFYGEGAPKLTSGDRAIIFNVAPEHGATAAIFSIDDSTFNYLRPTGCTDGRVKPVETYAKTTGLWSDTFKNIEYKRALRFGLSSVVRNMISPSSPHARVVATDLVAKGIAGKWEETPGLIPDDAVIIATITNCANASNPRNVIAAALSARNTSRLGLTRKPWVKSSLTPDFRAAKLCLEEAGLKYELEKLNFGIIAFAYTTYNGMGGALDPEIQQEIIDRDSYATAVLSGNRDFDGRIYSYAKQAFLVSPPLVVAYTVAGTVRFDIEHDSFGTDANGKPIPLKDLWLTDEEIDAIVRTSVKSEQFRKVHTPMFERYSAPVANVSPLYGWRPQSIYIRRPPYWEGALASERALEGLHPLAAFGDSITADHLSPSNIILASGAASKHLAKTSLPEEDFNSRATHRGGYLTTQRATLVDPTLINEMTMVGGMVKKESLVHIRPEGRVTRMWEAIETYVDHKQLLVVIAGASYGQGSSRGWTTKDVRLAGTEAIVAEGLERIRRTNLISMGVLPLEFKPGIMRLTLGIDGTKTSDVTDERGPHTDLTPVIHRKNDGHVEVPVTCRLDNGEEVPICEAGDMLQRFTQDLLESNKGAT